MEHSSPGEDQTEQGADEDEHLVEHGRVGTLDGTVKIILWRRKWFSYSAADVIHL